MKKWKKFTKMFATMAIATMCMVAGTGTTAFAFVDPAASAETEAPAETPAAETEPVVEEEKAENNTPFSIPGNAQVLDDITNDSSKQFYTITTKNNNTFYLIIDKSANTENVHMLSAIDETDLKDFLGESETEAQTTPPVVLEEEPQTETEPVVKEEEKSNGMNMGALIAILLLAAGGAGAYYFFKIRPEKEEQDIDSENLELGDGLETVDEDAEETDEDEETEE
ncbi:MAG: DUF4366 domain-containing protein [Clostridia bacterium]|nr:DUF4366 domain-containing protein [Clostridia bacterium]